MLDNGLEFYVYEISESGKARYTVGQEYEGEFGWERSYLNITFDRYENAEKLCQKLNAETETE